MDICLNPVEYALTHWLSMSVMVLGCALAIVLAQLLELNRPWPLSVILGGILSQLVVEAYPCAQLVLGSYSFIPVWALLSAFAYFTSDLAASSTSTPPPSLWDYFEEVDALDAETGATPWDEYSR